MCSPAIFWTPIAIGADECGVQVTPIPLPIYNILKSHKLLFQSAYGNKGLHLSNPIEIEFY